MIGTAAFASISGHLGIRKCPLSGPAIQILKILIVQDRSDDLESLGYMLLYFLRNCLPWQSLLAEDKAQQNDFLQKKKSINAKDLCVDLPKEFEICFDRIRSLAFNETPAYAYLRELFRDLFVRDGFEYDDVFDWTVLEYLRLHQASQAQLGFGRIPKLAAYWIMLTNSHLKGSSKERSTIFEQLATLHYHRILMHLCQWEHLQNTPDSKVLYNSTTSK